MLEFHKYHGAGNDFILIDNRESIFQGNKRELAISSCSRRFGIGSDGLIFIENDKMSDFRMDFYNPDGSQSFCGNGSRCAVAFAKELGILDSECDFKAIDGIHHAIISDKGIKIKMNDVKKVEHIGNDHFIHTGSPHYISYEKENTERDILAYGREIRYSEKYKDTGTNVNLINKISEGHIAIRTYERGVENETFACGTGATACGLSFALLEGMKEGTVDVDVKGGHLRIYLSRNVEHFTNVWLEGPAEFVFKGVLDV